ncbi:MAG: hypothetical protein QM757_10485 [Paludibaculum sp.]
MKNLIVCSPKSLPREQLFRGREDRRRHQSAQPCPARPAPSASMPSFRPTREHLAVVTTKYWGLKGVKLTVGFVDGAPTDLRKCILLHMNAWSPPPTSN